MFSKQAPSCEIEQRKGVWEDLHSSSGEGPRGRRPLYFSCTFKTSLYDPNPSNRPLSVARIIQSGFNFIQSRPPLSEFSGSALDCSNFYPSAPLKSVSDMDECSSNSHSCDVNAVCNNTRGSYTCTCKPGYSGDGKNCTG